MNVVAQLNQTTPPVWGGKQSTVVLKPHLLRRSMQSNSAVLGELISPFGLFSPSMILQDPFTMQIKGDSRTIRGFVEICSIALNYIDYDDMFLPFVEPIVASVSFDGSVYSCQNEDLAIITMSTTLDDCVKNFKEEIAFVWKEYGKELDDNLTDDAKELKRKVLRHIRQ